jgi:hypothetical protein
MTGFNRAEPDEFQTQDQTVVEPSTRRQAVHGSHAVAAEQFAGPGETDEDLRREAYGGFNAGAAFFGWLVAIALTVLLASILGALAAALGDTLHFTQNEAERSAGTIGISTGVALLLVLMIAYFAGGYVAGRMSRYDGGRQGIGVWLFGLIVTLLVVLIGAVAGSQYDIFQRIDLPSIPIPESAITARSIGSRSERACTRKLPEVRSRVGPARQQRECLGRTHDRSGAFPRAESGALAGAL